MRITAKDRKVINQFAREHRHLAVFSHLEIVSRYDTTERVADAHVNLAYFGIDQPRIGSTDLNDFVGRFSQVSYIEDHPSGVTVVDFYVYGRDRVGDETQLDTNVEALWRDGVLVALAEGHNVQWLVQPAPRAEHLSGICYECQHTDVSRPTIAQPAFVCNLCGADLSTPPTN